MNCILPCTAERARLRLDRCRQFTLRFLLWGLGRAEKSLTDGLWPWRPGLIVKRKTVTALMISGPAFGCFISLIWGESVLGNVFSCLGSVWTF